MKESKDSNYPNLVFRETFNSEQATRKNGGTPTNVTFSEGKGSFDGAASKINYNLGLRGTYSVRIRCNPTSFATANYILDPRGTNNDGTGYFLLNATTGLVIKSAGTAYVNGVATTTTVTGINNEIIVAGINLVQGTGANLSLIGSEKGNQYEFLGTIDLFEIYQGTLTASEVANLYNNTWNKELPPTNNLIDFDSTGGVIRDRQVGSVVGSDLVTNGSLTSNLAGWTVGGTIAWNALYDGSAKLESGAGNTLYQSMLISGKQYLVIADVYEINQVQFYGSSYITVSVNGNKAIAIITANQANLFIRNISGTTGYIKNIIVYEIRPDLTNTAVTATKQGALFNGTTSKIDTGTDMIGTKAITVCWWDKGYTLGESSNGRIIDNTTFYIDYEDAARNLFIRSNGASPYAYVLRGNFNNYVFNAFTRTSAGVVNIYLGSKNNAPVLSGSADQASGTPAAGTSNVTIGAKSNGDFTFDGLIPKLKVVEGILSLAEITQIWSETRKEII